MLRETEFDAYHENDVEPSIDDEIYCAKCGAMVTRGSWRVVMNGDHEHTLFNPHGRMFRVLCFSEAPGASDHGDFTEEFTWFRIYAWVLSLCRGCRTHLGWRYEGARVPKVFFGLIKFRLTFPD